MNPEIDRINNLLFKPCKLELSQLKAEKESSEYAGHDFLLNKNQIKFRLAKITPTKTGQFVTLWKRNKNGITAPFEISDPTHFYIIAVKKESQFGVFIFHKSDLLQHKILSDGEKEGKRGFRIYPPWDITQNKQAQKTQNWQINYFIHLTEEKKVGIEEIKINSELFK